jgi:hypothetical protein
VPGSGVGIIIPCNFLLQEWREAQFGRIYFIRKEFIELILKEKGLLEPNKGK